MRSPGDSRTLILTVLLAFQFTIYFVQVTVASTTILDALFLTINA